MTDEKPRYFVITGESGIGKTTIVKNVCKALKGTSIKMKGFYTEEYREGFERNGFDIVTLDGKTGWLARDGKFFSSPPKATVGKYAVLIDEFERIALPTLQDENEKHVFVIDELGKMELLSEKFRDRMFEMVDKNFEHLALITIPILYSNRIVEKVKSDPRTKLYQVKMRNRDDISFSIINDILQYYK